MEFPIAAADGAQAGAAIVVELFVRALGVFFAGHQPPNVFAVDFALGQLGLGELGKGREDVACGGNFAADGACRDFAGPAHDGRHAHASLPCTEFRPSERQCRAAVVAELEMPWAIVAGEDDDRIVIDAGFSQRFQNLADRVINLFDRADVRFLWILRVKLVRHKKRDVGHGVWHVEKEWFALVAADELLRLLGVAFDDRVLIHRAFDHFGVAKQRDVPRGDVAFDPGTIQVAVLALHAVHVVGVGDAEVAVEAVVGRQEFRQVADVPFTHGRSGIALGLENLSNGGLLGVQADVVAWKQNAGDAHSRWVAAGHQPGAGRRANRSKRIKVGELHSFLGHVVQVRGLDGFRTEDTDVLVALVVHENEDEVRCARALGG